MVDKRDVSGARGRMKNVDVLGILRFPASEFDERRQSTYLYIENFQVRCHRLSPPNCPIPGCHHELGRKTGIVRCLRDILVQAENMIFVARSICFTGGAQMIWSGGI